MEHNETDGQDRSQALIDRLVVTARAINATSRLLRKHVRVCRVAVDIQPMRHTHTISYALTSPQRRCRLAVVVFDRKRIFDRFYRGRAAE